MNMISYNTNDNLACVVVDDIRLELTYPQKGKEPLYLQLPTLRIHVFDKIFVAGTLTLEGDLLYRLVQFIRSIDLNEFKKIQPQEDKNGND